MATLRKTYLWGREVPGVDYAKVIPGHAGAWIHLGRLGTWRVFLCTRTLAKICLRHLEATGRDEQGAWAQESPPPPPPLEIGDAQANLPTQVLVC
jgi:hypothetical protein